ncbi:N-formylglutamate amidohydrolase [Frigidibacter sp. ROC022]|uniref:N-formylglutamate amidohydrolase n=1 Tax=Frigidibacter sp. ROC022 TaxID=2971796 RepID=UPI00215A8ACF|nr:N-formylglutamate amidohydrolase [Frigidibacter sp. ROC022]MCR8724284.1 N-formylglutamate amidohydrolase [Frigidibacter sp. ROC022]
MTKDAYEIVGAERGSRWMVTCDHASNRVPEALGGSLGLPEAEMARHIAYDVGAEAVSRDLARLLDAPAILSRFSRLVIDPNRGEDDPTLLMKLYDGTIIPGNRHADAAERERRLAAWHRPYHAAYAALAERHPERVICAVHSFTPRLKGRSPRPWQIGVLHSKHDSRLAQALIARLRAEPDLVVGDNEPYDGHLPGDSIDRHALQQGRPNVLIELRNDLIAGAEGQRYWAERLAPLLEAALADSHL